jgi:hypothetical protein
VDYVMTRQNVLMPIESVQLCVEVAFALSDNSHLTALELFDLPPLKGMAAAKAIARNATKQASKEDFET